MALASIMIPDPRKWSRDMGLRSAHICAGTKTLVLEWGDRLRLLHNGRWLAMLMREILVKIEGAWQGRLRHFEEGWVRLQMCSL